MLEKFEPIKTSNIIIIVKKRYILNNVMRDRDSCKYIMIIVKVIKTAKLEKIYNQFNII